MKRIRREDWGLLLCSNHIVGESWAFLRRRAGRQAAASFLDAVERSPRVAEVHVDPDVEDEGRRRLRRHDVRADLFLDAVSLEVMRRRRLREALAFDGDFAPAG